MGDSTRANTDKTIEQAVRPDYYKFNKYEVVDVIQDWDLNFCLGNVIKYVARAGKKDGNSPLQDLEKARQYLSFEIEEVKKCQQNQ